MTIETAPVRPEGTRWAWVVGLVGGLTLALALYGRWSSTSISTATSAPSSPAAGTAVAANVAPKDLPQPILASAPVGSWPVDLGFGFGSVWVVAVGDGRLSSLDLRSGRLERSIEVGGGPIRLAVDGGSVWVAQRQAHAIARIEPLVDVQLATIQLSGAPVDIAAGAGALWVAIEDDAVLRIDPATEEVVAAIAVPDRPRSLTIADGSVWVASRRGGTVARIDPASNSVIESRSVPGADRLAVTSDAVWVINALSCGLGICGRNGQLYRIDETTGDVVEGTPSVGLVTPGAGGLWGVVLGSNTLLRIDDMTGQPTSRAALGLERLPTALLETPGRLWIADAAAGRVLQIATAAGP